MENEIILFVAEFTGNRPDQITRSTLLFDDLGVDGDDAVELMEEYSKRYEVKLDKFNVGEYFGPEGLPPWFIFAWAAIIVKRVAGSSAHEASGLKPLSIDMLIKAAEQKKWLNHV